MSQCKKDQNGRYFGQQFGSTSHAAGHPEQSGNPSLGIDGPPLRGRRHPSFALAPRGDQLEFLRNADLLEEDVHSHRARSI